ncbi:MAG: GNAT family N-acetyltransferase [Ilumatobacteraceae bacterium]|nr:GNAT family N-acetyltransferase [Ilumatobacteraceae bacterium]
MSLVEQRSRAGVIWSGATTVRARPWPQVPSRAALLISGSHNPTLRLPDTPILQSWVDTLSRWGYESVRTSPVAPMTAAALSIIGFNTSQKLTLLERPDIAPVIVTRPLRSVRPRFPMSRMPPPSMTTAILRIDRAAFGDEWMMDHQTFREALQATQRARIFASHIDGELSGFVVAGITDSYGFIQRLAVHPNFQRRGEASSLVQNSLAWIHSRGCRSTVVNTEVSNAAALSIYKDNGFVPLDYNLSVMERQLSV